MPIGSFADHFLVDLLTPSLPFIEALQRYGWLAGPMKLLSALGSEPFFLLLLPLVFWNIDRRLGARLGALLIFNIAFNDVIKVAFGMPRPFWSAGVRQLAPAPETTFGFPSGHAQNSAALWTFLALQTRRPRLWCALALVLLVLVALSRLFLGAHYPLDVVGGALIGYAMLGLFVRFEKPLLSRWNAGSLAAQIGASALVCLVLGALYWLGARQLAALPQSSPGFETYVKAVAGLSFARRVGALFGLLCGLALARRAGTFEVAATRAQKIVRFLVGIAVLGALYALALSKRWPPTLPLAFAGYSLLTLWVTLGAPWLFVRLKLMRASSEVMARSQ